MIAPHIRVTLVVNSLEAPSETFLRALATGLADAGVVLTVHEQRPAGSPPASAPGGGLPPARSARFPAAVARLVRSDPGVTMATARAARRRFGPTRRAAQVWALAAPLAATQPDLVHFAYSGIAVAYRDACDVLDVPAVTSCRGTAELVMPHIDENRRRLLGATLAGLRGVHCVSDHMATAVTELGADPARVEVIRPAVDLDRFRADVHPQRRPGPFRVVTVARLEWVKGLDVALAAVRRALDAGLDVRYRIVGDGGDRQRLRYLVSALDLDAVVELTGPQPSSSIAELLAESDAFLLTSYSEGISNAALEAMATGLAVISTAAGGMGEAITDGADGVLVPIADAEAAASAIARLAVDGDERARLGRAARATVAARFDGRERGARFVDWYGRLLAGDEARSGTSEASAPMVSASSEGQRSVHPSASP